MFDKDKLFTEEELDSMPFHKKMALAYDLSRITSEQKLNSEKINDLVKNSDLSHLLTLDRKELEQNMLLASVLLLKNEELYKEFINLKKKYLQEVI